MKRTQYPSINGLRAISIILVIVCHLIIRDNILSDIERFSFVKPIAYFFSDGYLGVNVFFVISGFLITSLLLQEEDECHTISLKKFYTRRVLRIFPAYYFLLLVYFILQLLGFIQINGWSWVTSLTFTKYFIPFTDSSTMHTWSLSIEEHFYLLWPLIFMAGSTIRRTVIFLLIAIAPFMRIYGSISHVYWINDFTIFTRMDAIATGCLFALYQKPIIVFLKPYWTPLFWASVICLFVLTYLTKNAPKYHFEALFYGFFSSSATIANLSIAIIMMYSIFGPKLLWFKFLNLAAINYIGLLSYSLYLWQQLFLLGLNNWCAKFPQNVFLIIAMALLSFYLIEKPFLKLKRRFL